MSFAKVHSWEMAGMDSKKKSILAIFEMNKLQHINVSLNSKHVNEYHRK